MLTLSLALCAAASAAPPDGDVPASLPLPLREEVLDNGLRVIVAEDHRAPSVATSLLYQVGAAEDRPGPTGTAHLFEHLMFEGSANAPGGSFDEWLADAGANNNAWTNLDWTVYQIWGPATALPLMLFLEADRMGWLALTDEAVANQRGVVTNERLGDEADDDSFPLYALAAANWPQEHPYFWPVLGTMDDIQAAERGALAEWRARWYVPSNAILVIAGDVDPEAAMAEARRWFSEIPSGAPPPRALATRPPLEGEQRQVFYDEIQEPQLYVSWPTVPRGHPDEAALEVLAAVLSNGRGTRLDDRLYFDRDRTTGVWAWSWSGRQGGEFVICLSRDGAPLAPMMRPIDREVRRLQRRGPRPAEIERYVAWRRADAIRGLEDLSSLADNLAVCAARTGDPGCLAAELEALSAVTPADVQRVARTWLTPERVVLSVTPPGRPELALPDSVPVEAP